MCGRGVMVAATDLKSVFRKEVPVRVRSPAPILLYGTCPMRSGAGDPLKPSGRVVGAPNVVHTISFEHGNSSNFSVFAVNSAMIMADRRVDVSYGSRLYE